IEDRGIDAAYFWDRLFYLNYAQSYETARDENPVDFLTSGVFAAHFVNTVSQRFLDEIVEGRHDFIAPHLRQELINKVGARCATGILNAPDPVFDPKTDEFLPHRYGPADHIKAKRVNKVHLQRLLGLIEDPKAPIFFWPSRLDPIQKGCQLLSDIFYTVVSRYWEEKIEFVFVSDGPYQEVFRNIVNRHGFHQRVAVCDFSEDLEHQAYGAADFILMPSLFEPCGLPQMIAQKYGAVPLAHSTGGLSDTIAPLDVENNSGSGFLFEIYDSGGLAWAIDSAMAFYALPETIKTKQIRRIMHNAMETFTHAVNARQYIELYEKMLERPLIT
ncbi:MAG: glycosyltransferase, partial [Desulfatitalea sp.]|nr:glycosyltransferase [Desulfatitalea sp.]NNK00559.1 glycosyltransferase [Desulfatitalea sp.]